MKRIKETYLLFLIVIGLISLSLYSTYALFTASTTIDDVVEFTATLTTNSNILEYEMITVAAGETKIIELNITNSYESSLYYGAWYEILSPSDNSSINIGLYTDENNTPSSGQIAANATLNLLVGIKNNSGSEATINIGTIASLTSNLGLVEPRALLASGWKASQNLDNSGANYPALTENLVPVMYNGTTWVTADVTSGTSTYGWYDYDAKKWANAVLLTETKRNSLTKDAKGNYTPGQTIGDTESAGVLAFYVWIPRYKYKVWNINKVVATDTYGAQTKGIDIVFEEGTSTTGEITCTYDFTKTSSSTVRNEECTDGGNGYYTHPAFTFGSDELTGFWMGKFEMSSSSPADESGGYITTNLTPRFLPNVRNWVVNMLSNYWLVVKNMQSTNNIYGLSTNLTVADSHLITNMDWGAVAYLTHSKYGRCTSGSSSTCTEVSKNNSRNTSEYTSITGRSEGTVGTGSGSGAGTYTYNTDGGFLASTTGTIYGVYDMHGGAMERTMGNSSQVSKGYTFYVSDAGSNYTYSGNEKYLTTYAYGESAIDQAAYNRGRLGDATGETLAILRVEQEMGGDAWYSDGTSMAKFWDPWFRRGGTANDGRDGGIFSVHFGSGGAEGYTTSRAVLTVFPIS